MLSEMLEIKFSFLTQVTNFILYNNSYQDLLLKFCTIV